VFEHRYEKGSLEKKSFGGTPRYGGPVRITYVDIKKVSSPNPMRFHYRLGYGEGLRSKGMCNAKGNWLFGSRV
jgi:hypothetical protein